MYTLMIYRLLDEAHKQVSVPELQDTVWDETVTDFLQPHLHNIPVKIVEHFTPQQAEQSSAPELVTDTDQPSVGMETQATDMNISSSGMLQPIAAVAMQILTTYHIPVLYTILIPFVYDLN